MTESRNHQCRISRKLDDLRFSCRGLGGQPRHTSITTPAFHNSILVSCSLLPTRRSFVNMYIIISCQYLPHPGEVRCISIWWLKLRNLLRFFFSPSRSLLDDYIQKWNKFFTSISKHSTRFLDRFCFCWSLNEPLCLSTQYDTALGLCLSLMSALNTSGIRVGGLLQRSW